MNELIFGAADFYNLEDKIRSIASNYDEEDNQELINDMYFLLKGFNKCNVIAMLSRYLYNTYRNTNKDHILFDNGYDKCMIYENKIILQYLFIELEIQSYMYTDAEYIARNIGPCNEDKHLENEEFCKHMLLTKEFIICRIYDVIIEAVLKLFKYGEDDYNEND